MSVLTFGRSDCARCGEKFWGWQGEVGAGGSLCPGCARAAVRAGAKKGGGSKARARAKPGAAKRSARAASRKRGRR